MPTEARRLKALAVTDTLGSELARLRRTVVAATGVDDDGLPSAIAALLSYVGGYRSDYPSLSLVLPAAGGKTPAAPPAPRRPPRRPRSPHRAVHAGSGI